MGTDNPAEQLVRLLKIFETSEYAESFIQGRLYMNTVGYFRDHHDAADLQRGDSFEGVAGLFQPAQLGMLRIGDIEISPDSLAAPILLHPDASLSWNVFCMYALTNRGWPAMVSAETLEDLQATLKVDPSCFHLGSKVVLVENPQKFLSRVQAAIATRNFRVTGNLVEYYDAGSHHGWFVPDRAPFMKRAEYAHQSEWRLVVDRRQQMNEPYTLDIGDISDITRLTTPEELDELLKLRLLESSA